MREEQITFDELLKNASKFWAQDEKKCILVDEKNNIWLNSIYVMDENKFFQESPINKGKDIQIFLITISDLANLNKVQIKKQEKQEVKVKTKRDQNDNQEQSIEKTKLVEDDQSLKARLKQKWIFLKKEFNIQMEIFKEKLLGNKQKQRRLWNFVKVLIFFAYLTIICITQFSRYNIYERNMQYQFFEKNIIQKNIQILKGQNINSTKIFDIQDVPEFLHRAFVENINNDFWYNNDPYDPNKSKYFFNDNFAWVSLIRFRSKKVKDNSCQILTNGFEKKLGFPGNKCYAQYSQEQEAMTFQYPSNYAKQVHIYSAYDLRQLWFKKSPFNRLTSVRNQVDYQYYNQNGIILQQKFSEIRSGFSSNKYFRKILTENFIEISTRAIIIDINAYNPNNDYFTSCEITMEFDATGNMNTYYKIFPFRLYNQWSLQDQMIIMLQILCYFGMIFLGAMIIFDVYLDGLIVLLNFWNLMQLLYMTLLLSQIFYELDFYNDAKDFKFFQDLNFDLMKMAEQDQKLLAFATVAQWIGFMLIFKYLNSSRLISLVWLIIYESYDKILGYLAIYISLYVGFGFSAFLLLGSKVITFNSMEKCFVRLMSGMLGYFSNTDINEAEPIAGHFFILSFILTMYIFMSNIYQAVIMEKYDKITALEGYLKKYINKSLEQNINLYIQLLQIRFLKFLKFVFQNYLQECISHFTKNKKKSLYLKYLNFYKDDEFVDEIEKFFYGNKKKKKQDEFYSLVQYFYYFLKYTAFYPVVLLFRLFSYPIKKFITHLYHKKMYNLRKQYQQESTKERIAKQKELGYLKYGPEYLKKFIQKIKVEGDENVDDEDDDDLEKQKKKVGSEDEEEIEQEDDQPEPPGKIMSLLGKVLPSKVYQILEEKIQKAQKLKKQLKMEAEKKLQAAKELAKKKI